MKWYETSIRRLNELLKRFLPALQTYKRVFARGTRMHRRVKESQYRMTCSLRNDPIPRSRLDRLSTLLAERTAEISNLKSVADEYESRIPEHLFLFMSFCRIAHTKSMFQAKDKELAVLQQQHAVTLTKLAE